MLGWTSQKNGYFPGATGAMNEPTAFPSMRPDVTISTLGYGGEHDENVLIAIAESGGGNYHFIPDPALCQHLLAKALGAQADIVADVIELHVTPAEGVRVTKVLGGAQPQ